MEIQVYPRMDIRKENGITSLPKDGYKKGEWNYKFTYKFTQGWI